MRISIPLKANTPLRQFFTGRCVAVVETGLTDEISLTVFRDSQQDAEDFGLVGRNFSLFAPDVTFTGVELTSTVDTTVELIVSAYRVETLDGANLTVDVNVRDVSSVALLTSKTAVGAGSSVTNKAAAKTFQAHGATTAGAGSATIDVQGSNNGGATWDTIGTMTLTLGTITTGDSFTSDDRYALLRGNVTAISGTGASVSLNMGY